AEPRDSQDVGVVRVLGAERPPPRALRAPPLRQRSLQPARDRQRLHCHALSSIGPRLTGERAHARVDPTVVIIGGPAQGGPAYALSPGPAREPAGGAILQLVRRRSGVGLSVMPPSQSGRQPLL